MDTAQTSGKRALSQPFPAGLRFTRRLPRHGYGQAPPSPAGMFSYSGLGLRFTQFQRNFAPDWSSPGSASRSRAVTPHWRMSQGLHLLTANRASRSIAHIPSSKGNQRHSQWHAGEQLPLLGLGGICLPQTGISAVFHRVSGVPEPGPELCKLNEQNYLINIP